MAERVALGSTVASEVAVTGRVGIEDGETLDESASGFVVHPTKALMEITPRPIARQVLQRDANVPDGMRYPRRDQTRP